MKPPNFDFNHPKLLHLHFLQLMHFDSNLAKFWKKCCHDRHFAMTWHPKHWSCVHHVNDTPENWPYCNHKCIDGE
ncbi:hypothetical protein EUGRSUZ_H04090 [Eucalyptus grandis]|uniref:Uncharacterized protein n=2 Tax=Eucalyptus grandis TaxID=71139 RepID=A0ACC3JVV5_EUCGR|nr:hypothetical protein EUGRSUZ_H04090 [Eucalyptus grandis]